MILNNDKPKNIFEIPKFKVFNNWQIVSIKSDKNRVKLYKNRKLKMPGDLARCVNRVGTYLDRLT